MHDTWTPAAERHHLLPAERESFERARQGGAPPSGWVPLASSEAKLWVGPGLTVARRSDGTLELIEGEAARALLVQHAFRVTHEQRMEAHNLLPPGTPIPEAIAALAAAWPQFDRVDASATGALFMCPPQAVLACDGKHGELDAAFWYEGERAIDLVFQYGRSRSLPASSGGAGSDNSARSEAANSPGQSAGTQRRTSTEAPSPQAPAPSASPAAGEAQHLRIPLALDEGRRLRAGLALVAVGALAGPVLSLPLLAVGALAWLIGSAVLWALAIPMGQACLRRFETHAERPCLELQGHWLRVPKDGAMQEIDLRQVARERSWHGPIHAPPRNGGTRPSEARLHLRGPGVELLFVARHLAREPGFPESPSKPPTASRVLELLPADFRRLIDRL